MNNAGFSGITDKTKPDFYIELILTETVVSLQEITMMDQDL
jgi:hypothetical protein